MALPPPSTRPAYLDNLFRERYGGLRAHSSFSSTSSQSSFRSSASTNDLRSQYHNSRPLTPAAEESGDDGFSIRSKRSFLNSRSFRFGRLLNRRTYPQNDVQEMSHAAILKSSISAPIPIDMDAPFHYRRPSANKIQHSQSVKRGSNNYSRKPLPTPPVAEVTGVTCDRCYYFAARNCNGWVMGGSSGDACETCLVSLVHQTHISSLF